MATIRARYVLTPLEPLDLEEGKVVVVSVQDAPQHGGEDRAKVSEDTGESLLEMFDRLRKSAPGSMGWSPLRWRQELQALPLWPPQGRGLMPVVFADTGYFIASLDERDGLHARPPFAAA